MKKSQIKIVSLVLLSIIMIYIWWGNIQTFKESSYSIDAEQEKSKSIDSPNDFSIEKELIYRKPKLNPFKRYTNTQPVTTPKPQKQQIKKTEPKLSELYNLQGIISEAGKSQAIITDKSGNSTILSISENINNWTLTKIEKNYILFKNDKLYDTLWLQTIK